MTSRSHMGWEASRHYHPKYGDVRFYVEGVYREGWYWWPPLSSSLPQEGQGPYPTARAAMRRAEEVMRDE